MKRLVLTALVGVTAITNAAAAVVYSTGFESPTYTVGALAGQDGWALFGTTTVTVQTGTVKTGTQAVQVSGNNVGQSGPYHQDSSTGPLIDVSVDLYLASSSNQTSWQFAGLGAGLAGFLGGVDIDSNGTVHAITAGLTTVGTFTRNIWHNLDLVFNMTAQTYRISLDGVLLASNVAFCGDNGPCAGGALNTYGSTIFDTFGGSGNDSGFMDNLTIQTVPEPSTFLLLAGGLVLLARRRRA